MVSTPLELSVHTRPLAGVVVPALQFKDPDVTTPENTLCVAYIPPATDPVAMVEDWTQ
jgi:hypothetical protein